MTDGETVQRDEDPPCRRCHFPFANPDVAVVVLRENMKERLFHIPCYEQTDTLGEHRTTFALVVDADSEFPPDLEREVKTFSCYMGHLARRETDELEDDELERRWPNVMRLIAEQRTRAHRSAN